MNWKAVQNSWRVWRQRPRLVVHGASNVSGKNRQICMKRNQVQPHNDAKEFFAINTTSFPFPKINVWMGILSSRNDNLLLTNKTIRICRVLTQLVWMNVAWSRPRWRCYAQKRKTYWTTTMFVWMFSAQIASSLRGHTGRENYYRAHCDHPRWWYGFCGKCLPHGSLRW